MRLRRFSISAIELRDEEASVGLCRGLLGGLTVLATFGCDQRVDVLGNSPPITRETTTAGWWISVWRQLSGA